MELRGKTIRKSCRANTTLNVFLGILTGASKHEICCSSNSHNQSKMAMCGGSKSWFFRAKRENNNALNIRRILMLDLRGVWWSFCKLHGYIYGVL